MWCSCHLYSAKIQKFFQTQSTSSNYFFYPPFTILEQWILYRTAQLHHYRLIRNQTQQNARLRMVYSMIIRVKSYSYHK